MILAEVDWSGNAIAMQNMPAEQPLQQLVSGSADGLFMAKLASVPADSCSCGLRGCKTRPTSFPGRMLYNATKPGSVCPVS